MRYDALLLLLALSGCGAGATPAALTATTAGPTIVNHTYVFQMSGASINTAYDVFTDLGLTSQQETASTGVVLPANGSALTLTVSGKTVSAQFTNKTGGNLSVILVRDGVAVQSQSVNILNNSIHFDSDF